MFCSKCGAEIDSSLKYCVYCGEKVNASAPTPTKGKRKRKSMLVIILAVILIPVIIFSWIQGFGIHSSPEEIAKAFAQSELNADVKGMLKCLPDVMIAELIEYYELSPECIHWKVGKPFGG